jgi:excisionase family DNA binding protein
MSNTATKPSDRLLTPAEVAERCNATQRQVRRWLDERRMEFIDLPKGRRVRESALNAWLADRTVAPCAE